MPTNIDRNKIVYFSYAFQGIMAAKDSSHASDSMEIGTPVYFMKMNFRGKVCR